MWAEFCEVYAPSNEDNKRNERIDIMRNKYFYTIAEGNKFLHKNGIETTENITKAIKFNNENEMNKFWNSYSFKEIRKNRNFRRMEIECICRDY